MNYVYVSYGSSDIFCAGQLKKLIKKTVVTWCTEDDLPCGADVGEVIPSKVKGAAALLLILSPWAVNSKQVYRELLLADKYGIPVIPVKAGRVDLPEKFEYFLCDVTIKDISGFEYEPEIASSLVAELIKIAGKPSEEICEEVKTSESSVEEFSYEVCAEEDEKNAEVGLKDFEERINALLPVFAPEDERKSPDYTSITFAEDVISEFLYESGANCELSLVTDGPSFTRFIYAFGGEIDVSVIDNLTDVLHEKISPELPVDVHLDEAHDSIVVDIPTDEKKNVKISSFLKDKQTEEYAYPYPVGKDVNENCIVFDFAKGGNLLVSGGEDGERAAFLNAAVLLPALKNSPKDYSVILSDGDGMLTPVNALANICVEEKISSENATNADMIKIISPLDYILNECENRKQLFFLASDNDNKIDNFEAYNTSGVDEKLPLLLVVIGGINENYTPFKDMIEDKLLKIKGCEKYGIRLAMSSSIIGGDALSFFEERIYFKGKSDVRGTENLIGDGDLIFVTPDYSVRAQCAALTFEEAVDAIGVLNGMDTKICDETASAFIKSAAIRNFKEYTKTLQPVQLTLSDVDLVGEETSENEIETESEVENIENEEIPENTEILNADNADDSFVVDDDTVEEMVFDENPEEEEEETEEVEEEAFENDSESEEAEDEEITEKVQEETSEVETSEEVETEESFEENDEENVEESDCDNFADDEGIVLEEGGEKVYSFVENYSVPTAIEVDEDNLESVDFESETEENDENSEGEESADLVKNFEEGESEEPELPDESEEDEGEFEIEDSEEDDEDDDDDEAEYYDDETQTEDVSEESVDDDLRESDNSEESNAEEEIEEEDVEEQDEIKAGWTYVPEEERPAKIYLDALKLFIDRNRVGISILQQRPLMLNYYKAAKIVDWMSEKGYVSKPDEFGNRKLLISLQDYYDMYK